MINKNMFNIKKLKLIGKFSLEREDCVVKT